MVAWKTLLRLHLGGVKGCCHRFPVCTLDAGGAGQQAGQVFSDPLHLSGIERGLDKCPNICGTENTAKVSKPWSLKGTIYVIKTWNKLQELEYNVVTVPFFDYDIWTNLTDNHWSAFWDVNAVLPWDPSEIAKEPDEDWANSSGLAGLIAMESNYKAAPGDMVDHSLCSSFYSVHNDFCFVFTYFILTWLYHPFSLSLNLSQKMEAFCFLIPKKIQVTMWSILCSKGIENQFGLIREWQHLDGTLGRALPTSAQVVETGRLIYNFRDDFSRTLSRIHK